MKMPSVNQYKKVLSAGVLSERNLLLLKTLYYFPESSATALQLAEALGYSNFGGVNLQVGNIGKLISKHTGIVPYPYEGKKGLQPSYYYLIGEYNKETGWVMWDELRTALEELNLVGDNEEEGDFEQLPTEVKFGTTGYTDGSMVKVLVDRFERSRKARKECIRIHGTSCIACGFNFKKVYGPEAEGYIQVHHVKPLHLIRKGHKVNPATDLVPLCANCHSVVHLTIPTMSIDQIKSRIAKGKK